MFYCCIIRQGTQNYGPQFFCENTITFSTIWHLYIQKLMFNGSETATYASLVKGFSESIGRRSSSPKYGVGFESVRRSLKRNSLIPLASIFPSDAVLVFRKGIDPGVFLSDGIVGLYGR